MEFLIFLAAIYAYPETAIIAAFIYISLLFGNTQPQDQERLASKAENAQLWANVK